MPLYQQRITHAINAGFEIYTNTWNENGEGAILINNQKDSIYEGECLDIFEDGSYRQYCQFKGQQPSFKIITGDPPKGVIH